MTVLNLTFHKYRYYPYERRLAELEVRRLLGAEPTHADNSLHVKTRGGCDPLTLRRFTYFQNIAVADRETIVPEQARLEASAVGLDDPRQLRRQQTRYSAHGLHEYRGKFNPQMVRAVANVLDLDEGSRILDPFCGSGTVLLEARHQGFHAAGVDMSPLAATIANAKLAAVRARPESLIIARDTLAQEIQERALALGSKNPTQAEIQQELGEHWLKQFRCADYLMQWFPIPVLAQFRIMLDSIDEVVPTSLRNVFRTILSDIARDVSWQDPGDLRIRRRKDPALNYPAVEKFLAASVARVGAVVGARSQIPARQNWQRAFQGDSSDIHSLQRPAREFVDGGIDSVISSPPYANALPYIDTQRLSIALLGLASAEEIRKLDAALVGSRELSTSQRHMLEQSLECNEANVADEVWRLCKRLKDAYSPDCDGFRRRNTPAAIYRYFSGMTKAMAMLAQCLKRQGSLAFVVGSNRTALGGEDFTIDTPALLATTGQHVGLELAETHELDTYSRYDAHSRNSIRKEQLVIMRRP